MIGLTLVDNNKKNSIGSYLYDSYLYGSIQPQISFFKYVMRRNTNFFITNHTIIDKTIGIQSLENINAPIKLQDYISGDVDLLSNLYISFNLPEIYSNDKYKFKWVDNIAALLIKNISFEIDSQIIDSFTGEWLCVWNELSSTIKDNFNKMSGSSIEITNPRTIEKIIRIKNNIINDFDYPSSDRNSSPSIPSKWITVQLPFWFTKSPNLALPIFGNIYNTNIMYINYTLENIEKLYTIYSDVYNMNISPQHYNTLNNTNINITNFTKDTNIGIKMIATVITLDSAEKNLLAEAANTSEITYMIESIRTQTNTFEAGSTGIRKIDVSQKSLIKELVWTLKRSDSINNFNDTLNYSYNIPFNNEKSIMKNAYINWGKNDQLLLLSEQESFYFNKIQPYQYHNTIPKQGIYLYSFSLLPDKSIHTGSYNSAGNTNIININMTFNNYEPSVLDYMYEKKYKKKYNSENSVDLINTLYIVEYKFIIIINNKISIKYSD